MVADALKRKVVHTYAMITTEERLQDEMKRAGIDVMVKGGVIQMAQLTIQPTIGRKLSTLRGLMNTLIKCGVRLRQRDYQGILSPQTGTCYGKTACVFPETRES